MYQQKSRGFTLMEMLIVVAIVTILVAIAIPAFTGVLGKARAATCAANRRSLKAQLAAELMLTGAKDLKQVAGTERGSAWVAACVCPAGGVIAVKEHTITCSEHAPLAGGVETMLSQFNALVAMGKDCGVKYESNDEFRRVYLEKYKSFPQIELNGNTYYAQPYYNIATGEVHIFARADQNNSWYTSCIYDQTEEKWYVGKNGVSVANLTWADIKETMTASNWTVAESVAE